MSGDRDRVRVGVAGVGRMGMRHLASLRARSDAMVVAVADPSAAARTRASKAAAAEGRSESPHAYPDISEMLAVEHLDALVIATPSELHARHCLEAAQSVSSVLVEKPLATRLDDGNRVVREYDDRRALLMVGHVERFNPAIRGLLEHLAREVPGVVTRIETTRHGQSPERAATSGVGLDLAVHDADLICLIADEEPIYARATRTPGAAIDYRLEGELEFASGITARLSAAWVAGVRERRVVVHSPPRILHVDCQRQRLGVAKANGAVVRLRRYPGEPLIAEHNAFLDAVRNGQPSPVSGHDGLRALRVVAALMDSAVHGRASPVSGPDVRLA